MTNPEHYWWDKPISALPEHRNLTASPETNRSEAKSTMTPASIASAVPRGTVGMWSFVVAFIGIGWIIGWIIRISL